MTKVIEIAVWRQRREAAEWVRALAELCGGYGQAMHTVLCFEGSPERWEAFWRWCNEGGQRGSAP